VKVTLQRKALVALAILVAVGGGILLWPEEQPERSPRPEPPSGAEREASITRAGPAVFPRTAPWGDAFMGINEAVGFPAESMGGLKAPLWERTTLRRRAEATRGLGVTSVRASSHAWPYLNFQQIQERDGDLSQVDRYFATLDAHGLQAVVVIGPWPGARTANHTKRYLPEDLEAYAAWVQAVVERYDGDGVDDMPGLGNPVLAWEIDNEPDLHNSEPPRGSAPADMAAGFETPLEYATVLLTTAQAIRRADPEATVLSGGIYRPMTENGQAYLQQVLAVPGVADAIDGVSLHCYFSEDSLDRVADTMAAARELAPGKPIWITETSVPSDGRRPWIEPDWQARMVAGVYGAFLAEGADRIFWHSLTVPPQRGKDQPRGFGSNALLEEGEQGLEPKPAALVYQRLAEHLATVDPDSLHELAVPGGRLLATDQGWLAFQGEPQAPPGARTVHDLLSGERRPIDGGVSAPAWLEP
jgi:hypothetical protein